MVDLANCGFDVSEDVGLDDAGNGELAEFVNDSSEVMAVMKQQENQTSYN